MRRIPRARRCESPDDAVESGHDGPQGARDRYELKAREMGLREGVDLGSALSPAAELEDAGIVREVRLRK